MFTRHSYFTSSLSFLLHLIYLSRCCPSSRLILRAPSFFYTVSRATLSVPLTYEMCFMCAVPPWLPVPVCVQRAPTYGHTRVCAVQPCRPSNYLYRDEEFEKMMSPFRTETREDQIRLLFSTHDPSSALWCLVPLTPSLPRPLLLLVCRAFFFLS